MVGRCYLISAIGTNPFRRIVGWILTLRKLGDIFNVSGFHTWNLVMTIVMVVTWFVLFGFTVVAFWKGKIFISPAEAVIRDSFKVHVPEILEKHKQPDVEAAHPHIAVPEMTYVSPYGRTDYDVTPENRVASSRASTATMH